MDDKLIKLLKWMNKRSSIKLYPCGLKSLALRKQLVHGTSSFAILTLVRNFGAVEVFS